jgi:uncharacterized membrane protein YjfL (UPF0719 family)
MDLINVHSIVNVLIFSVMGIVILATSFYIFDKLTPGNLWKEIVEDHNVALAITMGAMAIGMAQIIASAVHG